MYKSNICELEGSVYCMTAWECISEHLGGPGSHPGSFSRSRRRPCGGREIPRRNPQPRSGPAKYRKSGIKQIITEGLQTAVYRFRIILPIQSRGSGQDRCRPQKIQAGPQNLRQASTRLLTLCIPVLS